MGNWHFLLLILLPATLACFYEPAPVPLAPAELPRCGNGILDPGELCDDGNRLDGDGCSSWCTAYDKYSRTCTLAGSSCSTSRSTAASPSRARFCNLQSIDTGPNGTYVVLADGAFLYHYELFLNGEQDRAVTLLPFTNAQPYGSFCLVRVLQDTEQVLAHDCQSQQLLLADKQGTTVSLLADLSPHIRNTSRFTGLLLPKQQLFILAGLARDNQNCITTWQVDVATGQTQQLQPVPCMAYNVRVEGSTERTTALNLQSFVPTAIAQAPCLADMPTAQCFVLTARREADLQAVRVYMPVEGGSDLAYVASTDQWANALGDQVTRPSNNNMLYSARGTCFTARDTTTLGAKSPKPIRLGTGCPLTYQGLDCAMPLNNHFTTEVSNPTSLLSDPVAGTHAQLAQGYDTATQYQAAIRAAWGGITPVDFVELPITRDIVYITQTSVGYLSSKGITLFDKLAPGYCRAHDMVQCPPGLYASVGEPCRPCAEPQTTVAYQVWCANQPYVHFSAVVDPLFTLDELHTALCKFAHIKGQQCAPNLGSISPMLPLDAGAQQFLVEYNTQDLSLLLALANSSTAAAADTECAQYLHGGGLLLTHWIPCALLRQEGAAGRRLLQQQQPAAFHMQHDVTLASSAEVLFDTIVPQQPPPPAPKKTAAEADAQLGVIVGILAAVILAILLAIAFAYRRKYSYYTRLSSRAPAPSAPAARPALP